MTQIPQEEFSDTLTGVLEKIMQPVVEIEILKRKEYLCVEEVAHVFNLNVGSLNTQRSRRVGPPYIKNGNRVLYKTQAVRDYLESRHVRTIG